MEEEVASDREACGGKLGVYADLPPNTEEGPMDPTYLQLFLLKYVCPEPQCFGTLAPLVPLAPGGGAGPGGEVLECNVCGAHRTEAQFLQDLEDGALDQDEDLD